MARARTVAVVVPSPAISFVFEATSWTRLWIYEGKNYNRDSKVQGHPPSTKVLKLVFELNGFGNRYAICSVVNMEITRGENKYTPFVILGAPNGCSMITFRPVDIQLPTVASTEVQHIPLGPSVTLTAFASTSTPANMLARPSLENLTSLCAYRREIRVTDEPPTTRRATLLEDWVR